MQPLRSGLMTETMPESVEPYTNISSKAYEHPADRAATAALKSAIVAGRVGSDSMQS